jgi:hypothetical protein
MIGWDSIVGIATGYGLESPGSIRCKGQFLTEFRPALGFQRFGEILNSVFRVETYLYPKIKNSKFVSQASAVFIYRVEVL